ncbi:Kelch repeat-containing protein [Rubrivirga sp. IMCC45206]|uniref:Kelch repeat-containing protein n=1 Tax=Rubrivirga sp. IMCC45206 TaxID=3391614 RepID=UPI00398FEF77
MRTLFAALLWMAGLTASAQSWSAGPPMPTPRAGAAVAVLDDRVYVIGGRDATGKPLAAAEVFTPGVGWSALEDLDEARADAAALVIDGQVVVLGGRDTDGDALDDAEAYDAVRGRWESFEGLETEREGLGAAVVAGVPYAVGGADEDGDLLDTVEAYDGEWSEDDDWTLAPGRAQAGVVSAGGALVVVGGFSALGPLARAERFDPGAGASALPDLPVARGGLAAAARGDRVFVVGGRDSGDGVRAEAHHLALGDGAWAALPGLPSPRESAVAAVVGNQLIVIGGADAFGGVLASVTQLSLEGIATGPGPDSGPSLAVAGANPTRGGTAFEIRTVRPGPARLSVLDVLGREVAVLWDRVLGPTAVRVAWRGDVPPGLYLVRLAGPDGTATARVTVAR